MRVKWFLALVAIAFVVMAAHKAYVGLTNRQPTRMTCADFAGGRSGAKWVVLTDCEVDVENAIGLESRVLKIDKGLYLPVRPVGTTGPARILLKTESDDATAGLTDARPSDSRPPDASAAGALADEPPRRLVATVSGLVESGFDSERKARRALDKIARGGSIREDYVVIAAGKQPDPADTVMGIVILAATVLVVGLVVRSKRIQARQRAAAGTPPPLPPSPPGA